MAYCDNLPTRELDNHYLIVETNTANPTEATP
jgi:hypothetical protein